MPLEYQELRLVLLSQVTDQDGNEISNEDEYILKEDSFFRNVWGNKGNDTIQGNSFDNVLNGDADADSLIGGAGNDTYRVDHIDDKTVELVGEGIDTVISNIGWTLGANVENLILDESGSPDFEGFGNELANIIVGNSGNNYLKGLAGDDTLDGRLGADAMEGGIGNDVYVVDSIGDIVTELAGEGVDTVMTSVTYTLADKPDVENVTLMGTAAIDATGNAGNNVLRGNAGVNVLTGGDGNDTYYIQNAGDQVVETSTGGTADRVNTTVSHTLANFVENLYASGSSSLTLTGNTLNNVVYGNAGANKINGDLGIDVLKGGAGKDTFTFNTKPSSSNYDKIVDFSVTDDAIRLDNSIFTKLGSGTEAGPKKLSSSFFTIGSAAKDSNDYLIYNNTKGALYYDADGSGSGKAVLVATLSKNLKMTNSDFYVI
jgi:Ca2+-binding RTX toxin-like protein